MNKIQSVYNIGVSPLYTYSLLNEDLGCKCYFKLDNLGKLHSIAFRCYVAVVGELTGWDRSKVICVDFNSDDMISYIIPFVCTARNLHYRVNVTFNPANMNTLKSVYSLYCCKAVGAVLECADGDVHVSTIPDIDKYVRYAIGTSMDETMAQFGDAGTKPQHILVPDDVYIVSHHDLSVGVLAWAEKAGFKGKIHVVTRNDDNFILAPTTWVQSINDTLTFEQFYAECLYGKTQDIINILFSRLFDTTENTAEVFKSKMIHCYQKILTREVSPGLGHYAGRYELVSVDSEMSDLAFYNFLSKTHSIATEAQVHGFAALQSKSAAIDRGSDQVVLCMIPGAIAAPLQEQDHAFVIEHSLNMALNQACEFIDFTVYLNTSSALDMEGLLRILEQEFVNLISFHINVVKQDRVQVTASCPGHVYAAALKRSLQDRFGPDSVRNLNIPHGVIPFKEIEAVAFETPAEAPKSGASTYVSNIKTFDDITPASIEAAFKRLTDIRATNETPIFMSSIYTSICKAKGRNNKVILHLENVQQTGSFKIRGSSNMLIKAKAAADASGVPIKGVIACSAGNHAQGVSKTSALLGIPCTIVCPETAPEVKLVNTKRYKAEVIKFGKVFDASNTYSQELCARRGWLFVPPYNSYDVIEGQGTIAYELLKRANELVHTQSPLNPNRLRKLDKIIVNVGGGGMISGIALYAKKVNPKIQIIGVQAERVFPLRYFNRTGKLVEVDRTASTIADGCNVKTPGGIHNEILRNYVDYYVGVSENEVAAALIHTLVKTFTLCEGAGVMGIAALMYDKLFTPSRQTMAHGAGVECECTCGKCACRMHDVAPGTSAVEVPSTDILKNGENAAVVICGGNIDLPRVRQTFNYGLISLGKLINCEIKSSDHPGMIAKFNHIAFKYGGVMKKVNMIRTEDNIDWDCAIHKIWIRSPCMTVTRLIKKELCIVFGDNIHFIGESVVPRTLADY